MTMERGQDLETRPNSDILNIKQRNAKKNIILSFLIGTNKIIKTAKDSDF